MKVNANLLRNGNVIRHSNKILQVINTNIIKPGKGGAYIQVEMRDLVSGLKTNERWRTSENIEKLSTEEIKSTYLFKDSEKVTLMNSTNYEQFERGTHRCSLLPQTKTAFLWISTLLKSWTAML